MNKNAIQKFAVWARVQLIGAVKQRAFAYEITGGGDKPELDAAGGRLLTNAEKSQRRELIGEIRRKGFDQVMEEAAYTWFNRFIALRFMEVNNYLPSKVRLFTDENGAFKPQILKEAMTVELDGLDRGIVLGLLDKQENEALYKYLLITQCNALNAALPGMFEKIANWTELLFPDNLLRSDNVLGRMISDIPEEDWKDAVQIIGWLYQYYNTELKDDTFAQLKKNIKITKERIPAATQLFTPDWIVRYMVENSLGRLWLEGHPNAELRDGWKYYLDEAAQEPEVEAQLAKLREEYKTIQPEDIKIIDPCMGSGHILVYAFDVLMQIYTCAGWDQREAAQSILKNNLFGLDIDDRAAQLAYFAVMMKARQYDRRLLTRGIQPNIYSIRESNGIQAMTIEYFHNNDPKLKADIESIVTEMRDAKEYGSILNITPVDFTGLYARFDEIRNDINMMQMSALDELLPLVMCAELLAQKYDVVVTNPPYMSNGGMSDALNAYCKKHYDDSRRDLYAVFIEHCGQMAKKTGFQALITQQSWMFINSYEQLRCKLLENETIVNMAHLGPRAFEEIGGEVVQTTSFVLRSLPIPGFLSSYVRLVDVNSQDGKETEFLRAKSKESLAEYHSVQKDFAMIPRSPVAYWLKKETLLDFQNSESIEDEFFSCYGLLTGHDEGFIFEWYEVKTPDISFTSENIDAFRESARKYVPISKGGLFRKWYGNRDLIVRYDDKGIKGMSQYPKYASNGASRYFIPCISWAEVCMGRLSLRYVPQGSIFSLKGPSMFHSNEETLYKVMSYLNSNTVSYFVQILNPTISCGTGVLNRLPIKGLMETDSCIARECVDISRADWDAYETSWDFKRNPLV